MHPVQNVQPMTIQDSRSFWLEVVNPLTLVGAIVCIIFLIFLYYQLKAR
jgi:hypothetical protein